MNIKLKLPDDYLEEEVRDGFKVSSEQKKVWAVELDLFDEFDRVCRENNIEYFASGGTILGAIRHGGYIPWDDDIDIMMHRKEYDRLCEIGPEAFTHPYFFQNQSTDRFYPLGHVQIRNSETTAVLESSLSLNARHNQGIFIDIFPLDNIPDEEGERERFLSEADRLLQRAKRLSYYSFQHRHSGMSVKGLVKDVCHALCGAWFSRQSENKIFDDYFRHITKYDDVRTEKCGLLYLGNERWHYYNDDLMSPVYKQFEMLTIPLPNGYERVMRGQYGDWETPVREPSVHGGVVFDTERPYKEFLCQK